MNPTKKTELIERIYWQCSREHHRHRTEGVAAECMVKHPYITDKPKYSWTIELYKQVLDKHRNGITSSEIAREMGLSRHYISHKIRMAEFWTRRLLDHV